jgi:hypothetical protein
MGLSWIIYVQQLRILSFSGYLRLALMGMIQIPTETLRGSIAIGSE